MVFLIQNTQNRDSEAMHIKMDELIRAIDGAHNALLNLEDLGERELDRIRADYIRLAEEARETLLEKSTGTSEVHEPEIVVIQVDADTFRMNERREYREASCSVRAGARF